MGRSGMSPTMWVVMSMLVATVVGFLTLGGFQDVWNPWVGVGESSISESEKNQIQTQCLSRKPIACQEVSGTTWAEEVTVQGKTCMTWAEQENVFATEGDEPVPPC